MSSVRLRPVLGEFPEYRPGRTLRDVAAEAGVDMVARLASNEVAEGPLPVVRAALESQLGDVNRYPDFHKRALISAVAERFDVDPQGVIASAGSVAVLSNIVNATSGPGNEVIFAWRSFEAYRGMTLASGATPVPVPLRDQRHDLVAMAAAVTPSTSLIIVCNPNNPTATVFGVDEFETFMAAVPSDLAVVLDEAYIEFVIDAETPNGMDYLSRYPNLIVTRTFSKAYGLAGLRAGYGVMTPELAGEMRKIQLQFGVNALAEAAAARSLQPDAELELRQRVERVVAERGRVVAALEAVGYSMPPSHSNFVLLELGDRSGEFASFLESRAILVRPYGNDGVRVSIGSTDENDRMIAAATEWIGAD